MSWNSIEMIDTRPEKIGILHKLTSFLCGFLLSFFIFMIFLKLFTSIWGALLGIILNAAASYYIFKKSQPKTAKRIVGYGVLTSIIAIVVLSLILWTVLITLFQGISN